MSSEPPEERGRRASRRLELVFSEHGESIPPPGAEAPSTPPSEAGEPSDRSSLPPGHSMHPFALVRAKDAPAPTSGVEEGGSESAEPDASGDATREDPDAAPWSALEPRTIRSLAGWLGVTGAMTLGIAGLCALQWASGRASVPSAVVSVLTFAIGSWSLLGAMHLVRAASRRHDGHELVRAFSNLRSLFILRAVMLFLVLSLSCFAFSIVASLLALL